MSAVENGPKQTLEKGMPFSRPWSPFQTPRWPSLRIREALLAALVTVPNPFASPRCGP